MKKRSIALLLIVYLAVSAFSSIVGQSIIKDTSNVKKPKEGQLYYAKNTKQLYLYRQTFEPLSKAAMPIVDDQTPPPGAGGQEIPIGYWAAPERILVAKLLEGKYHLLQTDATQSYYVPRGKNLLNDSRTKINSDIFTGNLVPDIVSTDSDLGGLYPPSSFKESYLTALGYKKNTDGEYRKDAVPASNPPIVTPPIISPPPGVGGQDRIKIPVGLILWDNWERDYWSDPNPKYDYLINHISKNRLAASEFATQFRTVPFWGQHHAPEKVKIRFNVFWNGQVNQFDEVEKTVTVKFDKTQADTEREVKYYRDAGFDWLCFNYYSDQSYLSENRRRFVAMPDKLGMKMTFMVKNKPSDSEVEYIVNLMTKDYWFKLNDRAVLYFGANDYSDIQRYKSLYKAKTGKDIYLVYYASGGYPTDVNDLISRMPSAVSAYNNTTSYGRTHADLMRSEVETREYFVKQYGKLFQLIPTLTTGLEELGLRTSLDPPGRQVAVKAATLTELSTKCQLMRDFASQNPSTVPAILWYSANEILESGLPIVPARRPDGTIDTSVIDTIAPWQE